MTNRDEQLRQKLEEAQRLLEQAQALVSQETQDDGYDTDRDYYSDFDVRLDTLWSELDLLAEAVDGKVAYELRQLDRDQLLDLLEELPEDSRRYQDVCEALEDLQLSEARQCECECRQEVYEV